jgi:hypothetical protein
LFNGILTSGIFSNSWSTAVLIPVFKKGNQRDPNNYRGISLVSCLAKLLTNIINNRLIEWSKVYDTITDAQFGFRNGLSIILCYLYLTHILVVYYAMGVKYGAFIKHQILKKFVSIIVNVS